MRAVKTALIYLWRTSLEEQFPVLTSLSEWMWTGLSSGMKAGSEKTWV